MQVEIKRAEPRTAQGGNNEYKDIISQNNPTPQWIPPAASPLATSIPNGHHQPNYGTPNVPPPALRHHHTVNVPHPPPTAYPSWGITAPAPVPSPHPSAMPPTGATVHAVMPPQTPTHPPQTVYPNQYTSPAATPNHLATSPVTHHWAQPPPPPTSSHVATTTPQPPLTHSHPWGAAVQHSIVPNVAVPTFASPPPQAVASTAQPTQFTGTTTAVYPPPSTPQPPSFWAVPTPPPTTQTSAVDLYATHHQPHPVASQHSQQQQQPKVAFSQYGGIAVSSIAAPVVASPVPPPTAYPLYQQNSLAPVPPPVAVAMAAPPQAGKPYVNTTGVEYYSQAAPGAINHSPVAPPHPHPPPHPGAAVPLAGGILVANSVSATPYSQPPVGPATAAVVTMASSSDLNAVSGTLGPQRIAMYTQPSQVQGYHPYRRM